MTQGEREGDLEEGELRATSDHLIGLAHEVERIEALKRRAVIGTDGFIDLADEVAGLARRLWNWAEAEQRLARETAAERAKGGLSPTAIEDVESRPVHRVLAEWREAVVRSENEAEGSIEQAEAAADAERLRLEYHRLMDQKDGG